MQSSILSISTTDGSLEDYNTRYDSDEDAIPLSLYLYDNTEDENADLDSIKDKLQFAFTNEAYTYDIVIKGSQDWKDKYASVLSDYTSLEGVLEIHKSNTETICYKLYYYNYNS